MRRADAEDDRLAQTLLVTLDLEHEALWLLGVVGGSVPDLRERATESFTEHRRSRDALIKALRSRGVDHTPAQPAYGEPPEGEQQCRAAVADVERRLVAAWLDLVRVSAAARRPRVLTAMRRSALAVIDWGGAPEAFPGLD